MAEVTSITLASGASQALFVENQDDVKLPPSEETWALDATIQPLVTVAPDPGIAGAWLFTAGANTTAGDVSGNATATFTPNGVTGVLGVTVHPVSVTALKFDTTP